MSDRKKMEDEAYDLITKAAEMLGWTMALGTTPDNQITYVIIGEDARVERLVKMIEVVNKASVTTRNDSGSLQ